MTVRLQPYDEQWPHDFEGLRKTLADALGDLAIRIDHIGSTSVPGLGAKDCIDIQVTVASLDERNEITRAFNAIGFAKQPWGRDHAPARWKGDDAEWSKLFFSPPGDERVCNVHVREVGRANQRYALLFRDFLRANADAATVWFEMKRRLATRFAEDRDAYVDVKDAATDVLLLAAERWADETGWTP